MKKKWLVAPKSALLLMPVVLAVALLPARSLAFLNGACTSFDDLDQTISDADIGNQGVRRGLEAKADNAREQFELLHETASGNVLCALLDEVDAQDGHHIAPASAQVLRDCVTNLALSLGIPLPCDGGLEAARIHLNSDGTVNGVNFVNLEGALFTVADGDALGSFKQWIVENADLFGPPPINNPGVLDELLSSDRPPADFGVLTAHRFVQTYRGHEVVGPQSTISLTVTDDGRAISFAGTVLDPRIPYAGLSGPGLSDAEATVAILLAWLARNLPGTPSVDEVRFVAVPARQSMGYLGEVLVDGQAVATIVVSAVTGEEFLFQSHRNYDTFDHRHVDVQAYGMGNDPESTNQFHWIQFPGSTFGDVCDLPSPPGVGCQVRMGDDRATVYDFELDNNSLPTVWTENEFFPDGTMDAYFDEGDDSTFQFKTQNVYQKMRSGLIVTDPKKDISGWDHHPDAPFTLFEKPPLSVFTNLDSSPEQGEVDSCGGSLGWIAPLTFGGSWDPVEHPYISQGFKTAGIAICSQDESVVFHELGHYYDLYSLYGFMGTGLASGTCVWDTSDEAAALAETIADMTAVYLYSDLYQTLPYDTSTTSAPCALTTFGVPGTVHGAPCTMSDDEVDSFFENRPSASFNQPCVVAAGYNQRAIMQAFWEYVSGRLCNPSAPYDCTTILINPDRGMEAMLYAEMLSNLQSYMQFFENMGVYLLYHYGQEEFDRYRSIMEHHEILQP